MIFTKRTHTCGDLRASDIGGVVTLNGWVNVRRNLGGMIFIDLRDRYGVTQVVFAPQHNAEVHEQAIDQLIHTSPFYPKISEIRRAADAGSKVEPVFTCEVRDEQGEVVAQVGRFDEAALMVRLETHHNVACGGGPVVAVMKAARALGAERATVLKYGHSGDVGERDRSHVVGYLSAALTAAA